jgi:hypothetical protein
LTHAASVCGRVLLLAAAALLWAQDPPPRERPGQLRGKPEHCAGARVTLWRDDVLRGAMDPVWDGRAGADGSFVFRLMLPPVRERAPLVLVAVARQGSVAVGMAPVPAPDAPAPALEIDMEPAVEMTGVVRTAHGAPIAGAWVWPCMFRRTLDDSVWTSSPLLPWHVATDAAGRFRLPGMPARRRIVLRAAHADFAELRTDNLTADAPCALVLLPGGRLEGSVAGPDGALAANVRTVAQGRKTGHVARSQTDGRGRYLLRSLPADLYDVWAVAEGLTVRARAGVEVAAGAAVTGQDVALVRGGTVTGIVLDVATGKPAPPGAASTIELGGPARPGTARESAAVAADSTFRILAPPGTNRVYVLPGPGWRAHGTVEVEVVENRQASVELRVSRNKK